MRKLKKIYITTLCGFILSQIYYELPAVLNQCMKFYYTYENLKWYSTDSVLAIFVFYLFIFINIAVTKPQYSDIKIFKLTILKFSYN